jgi:hypothetical protein
LPLPDSFLQVELYNIQPGIEKAGQVITVLPPLLLHLDIGVLDDLHRLSSLIIPALWLYMRLIFHDSRGRRHFRMHSNGLRETRAGSARDDQGRVCKARHQDQKKMFWQ